LKQTFDKKTFEKEFHHKILKTNEDLRTVELARLSHPHMATASPDRKSQLAAVLSSPSLLPAAAFDPPTTRTPPLLLGREPI